MRYSKAFILLVSTLGILLLTQSCYSVRLKSISGVPMPDPNSIRTDYYRDLKVIEKDTTISISITDKDFTMLLDCGSGGLHTVEYRNTFGGVFLSAVTLGKKRRVKIKYVCMKPTN